MKALLGAAILAATAALGGCEADDFLARGTVVAVDEIEASEPADEAGGPFGDLRDAEPDWRVKVLLDDGSVLTVTYRGERRYGAGERVRLLKTPDGELLL
jgi:hypothetical protein